MRDQSAALRLPDGASLTRYAEDIALRSGELVAELFQQLGFSSPLHQWRPEIQDVVQPDLRAFFEAARSVALDPYRLTVDEFETMASEGLSEVLMVVEPRGGFEDFVYTHYGSAIAAVFGRDMTGARVSDFDEHISIYFRSVYQAVAARGDWIMTTHEPPRYVFAQRWRRLIIPVFSDEGGLAKFAVANVSDNELTSGLDQLSHSAILIDDMENVIFANRAARTQFGAQPPARAERSVSDYTAINFASKLKDLSGKGTDLGQFNVVGLMSGTLVVHFLVHVSQVTFRNRQYRLVFLLPELIG